MAQNRIVSYDPEVDPDDLMPHSLNARIHPVRQSKALRGALDEFGWMDAVKVNMRTDTIIDGHLRVIEAQASGETVPVLWLDLDDEEERKALAVFDAITDLAVVDTDIYRELIAGLDWDSDALHALTIEVLAGDGPEGASDLPEPADHPLQWGYVAWENNRKLDCTESEVTSLDAAYVAYTRRNDGDDTGFVRWLVDGDRT